MNSQKDNQNGWNEWSKLVVFRFDQLEASEKEAAKERSDIKDMIKSNQAALEKIRSDLEKDIAILKTKATIWGSISGFVVGAAASIIISLFS